MIWPEIANGLWKIGRAGNATHDELFEALEIVLQFPLEAHGMQNLATPALGLALQTGLTAYDASYLVLASALDAPLVTFDTGFAGLYDQLELLS